ncbi:hypothetical protein B0O99DRAFT_699816 [Bisporella sp. PMI_857]|nr:hypothetical protein B0O99DRAFT_699816 [Bisporella sp. PMI_857]
MSPIERLSWEVLDLILSHLPKNDDDPSLRFGFDAPQPSPSLLPLYATVCKSWTQNIERRTFKSIRLKSTELDEFSRLVKGHRAAALSSLKYEVILPTYSEHACAKFETKKDQERNDAVFADVINDLFKIFKSWEMDPKAGCERGNGQPGTESEISTNPGSFEFVLFDIYSPMDGPHRGKDKYKEDRMQWELGKRHDLWNHRYEHSFLRLRRPETLPSISRISSFTTNSFSSRIVAPSSLAIMASKFTNLQNIQWTCVDDEKKYPEVRKQLRYDFAQGLQGLSLHSLVSIDLEYNHEAPSNHNFTPITALHSSSPTTDHLSKALHHLSQTPNLTTFKLDGPIVISPALFWPSSPEGTTPTWPKLQQFHLKFNPCTPSGGWYFMRHPSKTAGDDQWDPEGEAMHARDSESDTDSASDASDDSATWDSYHPIKEGRAQGTIPSRRFRDYPVDEEILPLLKAMAKAVARMPALQMLSVMGSPDGNPDAVFEVVFIEAGVSDLMDENPEDSLRPRLYWQTGDWRPAEEVLDLWEEAAQGLLVKFF